MVATESQKTAKTTEKNKTKSDVTTLNLCDGNKGGVGKSFCCRALFHWLSSQHKNVKGFDANHETPDFQRIYGDEIEVIKFSQDRDDIDIPNILLEECFENKNHCVVNLAASTQEAFELWFKTFGVGDLATEYNSKVVKWFVTTGEYESVEALIISLQTFENIPHILVKNQKARDWDYYNSNQELQELIKARNVIEIDLPFLPIRISARILEENLTLEAAKTFKGSGYSIGERAAVTQFIKDCAYQFEKGWASL